LKVQQVHERDLASSLIRSFAREPDEPGKMAADRQIVSEGDLAGNHVRLIKHHEACSVQSVNTSTWRSMSGKWSSLTKQRPGADSSPQKRQVVVSEWHGIISTTDGLSVIHDRNGRIQETTWRQFGEHQQDKNGQHVRIEWIQHPPGLRINADIVRRARSCIGCLSGRTAYDGMSFAEWSCIGTDAPVAAPSLAFKQQTDNTTSRGPRISDWGWSHVPLREWTKRHWSEIQTAGIVGVASGLALLGLDRLIEKEQQSGSEVRIHEDETENEGYDSSSDVSLENTSNYDEDWVENDEEDDLNYDDGAFSSSNKNDMRNPQGSK
jgi:hypothetical protein